MIVVPTAVIPYMYLLVGIVDALWCFWCEFVLRVHNVGAPLFWLRFPLATQISASKRLHPKFHSGLIQLQMCVYFVSLKMALQTF